MMMKINIEYENATEKKAIDNMLEVAYYACEQLVIDHMNFNVNVFVDDMSETTNGMVVECMDDGYFLILIRERDSLEDMIITLVHELVHVKQYLKDSLSDCIGDVNKIPYLEQWWEKEAFSKTVEIVKNYVHRKLN